jgi:hypothetical protein
LEQLEDAFDECADLERQLREGAGNATTAVTSRLGQLRRMLGEQAHEQDELLDYWDAELAAGRVPDLEMTAADLPGRR